MKGTTSYRKLIAGCAMMLPMAVYCWIYMQIILPEQRMLYKHVVVDFFISAYFVTWIFPGGFLILLFLPGAALIICHFKGAPFTRLKATVTFAPMALFASINLILWTHPNPPGFS